jgi:hypothetical protein
MTTIEAEDCWRTIQRLLQRTSDSEVLVALAAGPLQLLIADAGPRFIDEIEREAWSNPAFCQLLTFVWDCTPMEVWAKVDAVRTVAAGGRTTRGASVH